MFQVNYDETFICNVSVVKRTILSTQGAIVFLSQVSIVPRTNANLGYAQYLPSDNKLYSTEQVRYITRPSLNKA